MTIFRPWRSQYAVEVGDPRHRAVVVHDLADHAGRDQPGEAREIDRRLGLPDPLEHAAGLGLEREHVARLDEVARARLGSIATWIVRARSAAEMPVLTPVRASIETVNARLEGRLVLGRHQVEAELVAALGGQRQADQAARPPWP